MAAGGGGVGEMGVVGEKAAADFVYRAEMGFTHQELLRLLPRAVLPYRVEKQSALAYCLQGNGGGGGRVLLTLKPQGVRNLAAIALPVTEVKLEFFGFNEAGFGEFMHRYKRYLHKGGG